MTGSAPGAYRDGGRRLARLAQLREAVLGGGPMRLAAAASLLSVSAMTVRRDLESGVAGLALLGGHVIAADDKAGALAPYVFERERDIHGEAKRVAGRRAARLVTPGETIFIDCGTTLPHLVTALPRGVEVTIVCYALNIATLACARPGTRVIMLGGMFYPESATFMSDEAIRAIARLGINKAFLSAGGLHESVGASCSHFHEVPIKRAVLARAMVNVLVMDASKLGQVRPARFAAADDFDAIVTEAE